MKSVHDKLIETSNEAIRQMNDVMDLFLTEISTKYAMHNEFSKSF